MRELERNPVAHFSSVGFYTHIDQPSLFYVEIAFSVLSTGVLETVLLATDNALQRTASLSFFSSIILSTHCLVKD